MENDSLNQIIDNIITPVNVRLGHTWLKRKLHEAMGDASTRKDEGTNKYVTVERTHTKPGPCGSTEYGFVIKPYRRWS